MPRKCWDYDCANIAGTIVVDLAEERACFAHILSVSWPSFIRALTARSRKNKMAVTTENKSEKSSSNIYTHPVSLSLFSKLKLDH